MNPNPSPRPSPPEDDAISLKSKSKPGPELYVAVAKLYAGAGNIADAEKQYQMALKANPEYLPALLGYAQLKEQEGKSSEALEMYRRAAQKNPQEASVHNNLGLYYARQNRPDDAVASLRRAIQLEPKNPRYRNNIAMVLVDQGKTQEAFGHLSEVNSTATAYYNLGYLLNKKGQTQAAFQYFSQALRADPSMIPARRWTEYLQKQMTQARLPNHPAASGVKITGESSKPADAGLVKPVNSAPMPPDGTPPRRLPPTFQDRSDSEGPTLPGISYNDPSAMPTIPGSTLPGISYKPSATPIAPLPPVTNSALRPLPRVQ